MVILGLAILCDYVIGDPRYSFHPVRLVGRLISAVETILFRIGMGGVFGGVALVGVVLGVTTGFMFLACQIGEITGKHIQFLIHCYIVYSCIAYRDLIDHLKPIHQAIVRGDFGAARENLKKVVGRDVTILDVSGIGRAAIETMAENFVDGFLSPLFWYITGYYAGIVMSLEAPCSGLMAILAYRTVNTLDSMVGYKNERYYYFGRFSARLDDVMNFIPARLSVPVFYAAACMSGLNSKDCLRIASRDRLKHTSPNAGHPESCIAGSLGVCLGGPTRYTHGIVEKPWIGDGRHDVNETDIANGLLLIRKAYIVTILIFIVLTLFIK